tara:strand:+ start:25 stop:429 length:405 start_codon:yes stop_codon:yes gene_type:complete
MLTNFVLLKKLVAIGLFAILFLPFALKLLIYIEFKVKQDFIAEVLCVNRDKPITMCGGKCYLNKQLNKLEEQENDIPDIIYKEIQSCVLSLATFTLKNNSYYIPEVFTQKSKISILNGHLLAVFHPPQFLRFPY